MSNTLKIYESQQEISKFEQAAQSAKPAVIPFIHALNSATVRNSADEDIKISLHEGISVAIFDLGHTKPAGEKEMMIVSLLPQVKSELANITLGEIKLFCKLGAQEKYGENMGVNVVAVLRWLHAGMVDAGRVQAKQAINPPEPLPKALDYSRKDWIDRICLAFEKYKEMGFYHDFGNPLYDFLEKEGFINFTVERKNEIKAQFLAKENDRLTAKLETTKATEDRTRLQKDIERLRSGQEDLRSKLKREALQVFFQDCVDVDLDLRLELESKEK